MAKTTSPGLALTILSETEVRMTRVFDAPRALVFEAFARPEHIRRWWGREQDAMPVCEMDFRPGGKYRYVNRGEDGVEHAFRGEYTEIVYPERIVSTFEYEGFPGHVSVDTLVLTEEKGKTTLTATTRFASREDRDGMLESGMEGGATESYGRLGRLLAEVAAARADDEANALVIERVFDAPREMVWRAWTEPEQLKRWFGPRVFTVPVLEMDFRVGGRLHFAMRAPDGRDFWSLGIFEEIVPMERLVYADCFADEKGNVVPASHYGMEGDVPLQMRVSVTFEDAGGGRTRMVARHVGLPQGFPGADQGWNESFDKLAEMLAP